MWGPLSVLTTFSIGRVRVTLYHKDPCTDGSDHSCKNRALNKPYEVPHLPHEPEYIEHPENQRFLSDLKRYKRLRWLHVHHWRLSVRWIPRVAPKEREA